MHIVHTITAICELIGIWTCHDWETNKTSWESEITGHYGMDLGQGWVSRSQIVSQNLRSICDKHAIKLRLEKRVTGKDCKVLVIHTHAQRTRSIYDDIPTLRVPDGCRRMLAVYERNQR